MRSKYKITKADKRKKSNAKTIENNGLTTSFRSWNNAGHASFRRCERHDKVDMTRVRIKR